MTARRESLLIPFVLLVLVALFITACGDQPPYEAKRPNLGQADWCGFTWVKSADRKPADIIRIERIQPRWEDRPGICRNPNNLACTDFSYEGAKLVATVLVPELPEETISNPGHCDRTMHELLHALGLDHVEPHLYVPRDYARRSSP